MSFPFDSEEEIEYEDALQIPKEYEIDFETGRFTGRILEGVEAIKAWVYLALRTNRYQNVIQSWDYGSELEELIGQSYTEDYLEIEAKRMVEECLLINENITEITEFSISVENDKLSISFTVITPFGEVDINV